MDIRQALQSKGVIQPDQAIVPQSKVTRKTTVPFASSGSIPSQQHGTQDRGRASSSNCDANDRVRKFDGETCLVTKNSDTTTSEFTKSSTTDGDTDTTSKFLPANVSDGSRSNSNQSSGLVTEAVKANPVLYPSPQQRGSPPSCSETHLGAEVSSQTPQPTESSKVEEGNSDTSELKREKKKVYWDLQQIEEKAQGIIQSVQRYYKEREKTAEPDPDSNLEISRVTERIRQYNLDICRSRVNDLLAVCEQAMAPLQNRLDVLLNEMAFLKENVESCKGDDMYVAGIRQTLSVACETKTETQQKLSKISATVSSLESCLAICS